MDFGKSIDGAARYFQGHPLMGVGIGLALIVLLYLKPKAVFKVAVGAAIISAVLYVVSFLIALTETGIHEQDKFLDKPHVDMKNL